MKSILDKQLVVTMQDGSKWAVPVSVIALNRACSYAKEFGGDTQRSLDEDTIPLFESDSFEIKDWAANNMNWKDVADHAKNIQIKDPDFYQDGWVNGYKEVV